MGVFRCSGVYLRWWWCRLSIFEQSVTGVFPDQLRYHDLMANPNLPMSPLRPHLVSALLAWIVESDMTPYVVVDTTLPGVSVPPHTAQDGRVTLNLSASATRHLVVASDHVAFSARFGGQPHDIYLPMASLLAVFAHETGLGMGLPAEVGYENGKNDPSPSDPAPQPDKSKRAHLRVVK